ncbi:hypothetical protein [Streptomyces sp. NBC_00233]|uniref:hypothetical protein n=1 Tax=Streptomyces sp. NBC_00233 TaxID=2975686 RepID=UPI002255B540|nr:hypothetical protein [Streptomyces sp. NBC_00233]MCX5232375.1 hypothetical protein [Streptomyces sp. NBC_00233]
MTEFQALTTAPRALLDLDPYRFPAVHLLDDLHGETSAGCGIMEFDDYSEPEPTPSSSPSHGLEPADRRRLELHATLTAAGIAPLPGDLDAIDVLSTLDDSTHIALRRWLGWSGTH